MGSEEQMRQFVGRLHAGGVARPGDLRGCSAEEVAALEQKYGLALPRSYALFLSRMGHAAGKLGNCGEFDLSYADAPHLTGEERDIGERSRRAGGYGPPAGFPPRGLICCARLGNPDYWAILCEGQDDSPVIHFDYADDPVRFKPVHASPVEFLDELRRDAEHWISRGML